MTDVVWTEQVIEDIEAIREFSDAFGEVVWTNRSLVRVKA